MAKAGSLLFHPEENLCHDVNRNQDHVGLQRSGCRPSAPQAFTHLSVHPAGEGGCEEPLEQSWAETWSTESI